MPSLYLPQGIHWFKGANGSGKTTFFRTLAGMLPFEGSIQLDEWDIGKDPVQYRLHINYGEAEPDYPEFLTAHDLIQFVATAKRATSTQVSHLIDILGITPFLYQPTGTYSSGMLKKTSLALAFLGNPKVIILDEPLITIDDATVQRVYELVRDTHARGVGFLLSSHQDFRFDALPIQCLFEVKEKTIVQLSSIND
ncbi:MAG: ABC transporter ATP-binding protein [Spirosomataceae bacterium]